MIRARMLVPGEGQGPLLRLDQPLSFWGGIDPGSGLVIASGHPQQGRSLAGHVVALPFSVGSSSGSSILLELLSRGLGPAGLILARSDQILTLGAVIAAEMGYERIPVALLDTARFVDLPDPISLGHGGEIRPG